MFGEAEVRPAQAPWIGRCARAKSAAGSTPLHVAPRSARDDGAFDGFQQAAQKRLRERKGPLLFQAPPDRVIVETEFAHGLRVEQIASVEDQRQARLNALWNSA